MAGDLRTLVMTLKISTDIERVGDHAVNIAQCARRLAEALPVPEVGDLDAMADVSTGMLRDAIAMSISTRSRPVDRAIITHAHTDHARWGCRSYLTSEPGGPAGAAPVSRRRCTRPSRT